MLKIKDNLAKAKKVVVVGGSFIGSETAASIQQKYGANI